MAELTPFVLSIAGFDPSGGAGILADVKTFEAHKIPNMAILSALTFQNDNEFDSLTWISPDDILKQLSLLRKKFAFKVVKIGLIESLEILDKIMTTLKNENSRCMIIWDPIVNASAGFQFHSIFKKDILFDIIKKCSLITPNTEELIFLTGKNNYFKAAEELSAFCPVLLKGGHNSEEPGVDYLFSLNSQLRIPPTKNQVYPKHGSGCVLSSAIASHLYKGNDLPTSCIEAKKYVEKFLSSNPSLLGTHYVQ